MASRALLVQGVSKAQQEPLACKVNKELRVTRGMRLQVPRGRLVRRALRGLQVLVINTRQPRPRK